jgi:hypothetical protein
MESNIDTKRVYDAPDRYERIPEAIQNQIAAQIENWRSFTPEVFLQLVTPKTR